MQKIGVQTPSSASHTRRAPYVRGIFSRRGMRPAGTTCATQRNSVPAGLVPVLPDELLRTRYDYYLVSLPEKAERPSAIAFRDWLLAEGRNFMATRDRRGLAA